jgi:hypothetical protein
MVCGLNHDVVYDFWVIDIECYLLVFSWGRDKRVFQEFWASGPWLRHQVCRRYTMSG